MIRLLCFTLLIALPIVSTSAQEESDDGPATQPLKVATYNVRYANPGDGEDVWPNRQEFVIEYCKRNDIIGLQEVTEPQFAQLRAGLTDFDSYGVGRDDGKSGGEHAPFFYRSDKFEVIDKGTFWLSESPETVGVKGWDAALPRTCTWIHFRDKRSGAEFYVANTHFDHRGAKARAESGKLLAKRLGQLPKELPIILMGDFNCMIDSEPYNAIVTSLTDARNASESDPTGPNSTWNGFKKIQPDRIIDHIFVRAADVRQLAVHDPKTDRGRFASDHLPVQIVVSLEK
ncbi:Endonuclease/Exonuclease/phosphatase family protein [Stieleria maiorica]|uniref:Endonuclease/Exonuclease/phosphatase family protein n=1 Tax=Stieleria maiorica TaxID=2795974 RepID=A0A5B9MK83_9BACT|nr:endonuclease/exonuclease/phosphatase family protein [Stieleria maiorica]QEG00870.1 Endonuclease/Exonuclease/phosphatase family protein [Stieleria maiorica]